MSAPTTEKSGPTGAVDFNTSGFSLNNLSPADAERLRRLRRMKAFALSLLVIAAVIYLATIKVSHAGIWGWVNTGAEAAMVGAMADWFAVTALFRYPLGLKIPHTAIVPTKKDELALSIQDFFTENFLTEEIARERLATAHIGLRIGTWLQDSDNSARASRELARVARAGIGRISDADVSTLVADVAIPRLANEPVSIMLGDLLDGVVHDGAHKGFVDMVVREVHDWLVKNPESFKKMIGNRAPWWSPDAVNTRVVDWTYQQAIQWAADILDDPEHQTRKSIDDLLLRIASDLKYDVGVQRRAEALVDRLVHHPQLGQTALNLWRSVRESLLTSLDDPHSQLNTRVRQALRDVGTALVDDPVQRERVDARVGDMVAFFINTYGHEVSGVISHTIQRWDGQEASQRIELYIGRDLQFIRINGTVVGCLVGLIIHGVTVLVS